MTGRARREGSAREVAALGALAADPRLPRLGAAVPPLSLPRAFGVERDEVAHSRALAEILDPRKHRGARAALASLLGEVAASPGLDPATARVFGAAREAPWERLAVRRERLLIDVVVELSGPEGALVLGIENKIDAAEQPEQLARYQASLSRAYPGRAAAMAFLTPTGHPPSTADAGSPVPVVALGYDSVARALGRALEAAPPESDERHALSAMQDHVRGEILGEGDEVRAMARGLWREHRKALRLAIAHRPNPGDIKDELVGLLRARFGDEANVYVWPERGAPSEIKLDLWRWFDGGFPFTFMLHEDPEGRPAVRVLSWRGNFERHADALAGWAPRANEAAGYRLFDERFTRVRGWDWHKVLAEEDYPDSAALREDGYDRATAREAAEEISALVEMLRPYVEGSALAGAGP